MYSTPLTKLSAPTLFTVTSFMWSTDDPVQHASISWPDQWMLRGAQCLQGVTCSRTAMTSPTRAPKKTRHALLDPRGIPAVRGTVPAKFIVVVFAGFEDDSILRRAAVGWTGGGFLLHRKTTLRQYRYYCIMFFINDCKLARIPSNFGLLEALTTSRRSQCIRRRRDDDGNVPAVCPRESCPNLEHP